MHTGISRRRRAKGNGGNTVQVQGELVRCGPVALADGLQLLAEELHVQLGGAFTNQVRIDLFGHRLQHPLAIFFLKIER